MDAISPIAGISAFTPELCLLGGTLILLLYGLFVSAKLNIRFVVLTAIALFGTLVLQMGSSAETVYAFKGMLINDGFTRFAKLLTLLAALMVLLISSQWLTDKEGKPFEYVVLLCFSTLGLLLLISAQDFLTLYMALELASLPMYVLASFNRDSSKSTEAGLKYFVLGALSSCLLLFGISLVYGFGGSTGFDDLTQLFASFGEGDAEISKALVVGMVFVVVGMCFKISAVPFHMWTPDVYEGAPTPVVSFFAVVPKVAVMALFVRVLMQLFGALADDWQQLLVFSSLASMLVGALGALLQNNIKRLLAYSSIGHVGFMLMGLATNTAIGAQSVLIYLTLYVFMSVGAFGCLLIMRRDGHPMETMADLSGLSKLKPRSAFLMAVFMFSMAGIPPMAGFFGKMYVVLAAMNHGLIALAIAGLLISVISCYYYLRVVKVMYFDQTPGDVDIIKAPLLRFTVSVCAIITLAYIAVPALLVDYAKAAANALFR
jgi:NADH-quinone oxidoreductase subunit N